MNWIQTTDRTWQATCDRGTLYVTRLMGAGAECYIWRPADWDEIVAKLEFNTKEAT